MLLRNIAIVVANLIITLFLIYLYDRYYAPKFYVFDFDKYVTELLDEYNRGKITQEEAVQKTKQIKEQLVEFSKKNRAIILFKTSVLEGTAPEVYIK